MKKSTFGRVTSVLALSVLAVFVTGNAAEAHVTVNSPNAKTGGYAKLIFQVPTESSTANTVKVEVSLPVDNPFGYVGVKPHAGWKVEQTKTKLAQPIKTDDFTLDEAVTKVTWTADANSGIIPGQFDEFELVAGAMPATAQELHFPTVQTYSDGTTVDWTEIAKPGAAEPEHPAPTLKVAAAAAAESTVGTTTDTPSSKTSDTRANVAIGLGALGVVLGLIGLTGVLRRKQ